MYVAVLLFVLGIVILIAGANYLVDGSSALAKRYNVSDIIIGLTIVAFGTSAPELVVNLIAAYNGYADIVYGNIIGSNNFNLFIIIGICGICAPLMVKKPTAFIEIPFSFSITVILFFLLNDHFFDTTSNNVLSRFEGITLLCLFLLFLWYIYKQLTSDKALVTGSYKSVSVPKIVFFITLGLLGLILGGRLVVANAKTIAQLFDVNDQVIGLTIVAAGTSLPELATSLVSIYKKNVDMAVGNVIGSNIFNILLVLGASSLMSPIPYHLDFNIDLFILLGGSLFVFLSMFFGKKKTIGRLESVVLFVGYVSYIIYRVVTI